MSPTANIRRYQDVAADPALPAALDAIFFEASSVKSFATPADRAAFRERWLGRYLDHDPAWAYVAYGPDGAPSGYLVGAIDDPARTARFADIPYFASLAAQTARFPAHLHVNLAPAERGHGLGAALVAAFVADLARASVAGLHVVTGAGMRNVAFYERLGFREVARLPHNGKAVVMLARSVVLA